MTPSQKLFKGRLGRMEDRARATARLARPGSVPGMRVSQTSAGAFLSPINPPAANLKPRLVDTVTDHWDWLECADEYQTYEVLKPAHLRTDWEDDHLDNFSNGLKAEYLRTSASMRAVFIEDTDKPPPPSVPPFGSTADFAWQTIWPAYFRITPAAVSTGRQIMIARIAALTLTVSDGDALATPAQWTEEKTFVWIDLNIDARRWVALPWNGLPTHSGTSVPMPVDLTTYNLNKQDVDRRDSANDFLTEIYTRLNALDGGSTPSPLIP